MKIITIPMTEIETQRYNMKVENEVMFVLAENFGFGLSPDQLELEDNELTLVIHPRLLRQLSRIKEIKTKLEEMIPGGVAINFVDSNLNLSYHNRFNLLNLEIHKKLNTAQSGYYHKYVEIGKANLSNLMFLTLGNETMTMIRYSSLPTKPLQKSKMLIKHPVD